MLDPTSILNNIEYFSQQCVFFKKRGMFYKRAGDQGGYLALLYFIVIVRTILFIRSEALSQQMLLLLVGNYMVFNWMTRAKGL